MSDFIRRLRQWVVGSPRLPESFTGTLETDERVLAVATTRNGGAVVATRFGLWLPEVSGSRRVGWHLISKASWKDNGLTVVEAESAGSAGEAELLTDLPPRRYLLSQPGRVPEAVHKRVNSSISSRHHRELPGGGAWFVQRRVPGRDGILLQVRLDPGTDRAVAIDIATEVAAKLAQAKPPAE
ncbi:hypothetical protein [Actinoalloteichus hymeniacidonis]|uniref:Uncharacterized protein n=1 Tax=Actinoalloteichus hymeniacidonis TaxID=340345 RepID=A0AAC9HT99_9PSEU|nr:hypothetical protein [Actinoalloteichus hymeniacidonis]AOS65033.1 hypothetical protein TL08_21230 [Actinoalloteichus hymeniacidonis]MBB5906888.1 hypothetical protein [Actinoalloteichus hymeniacidonis]